MNMKRTGFGLASIFVLLTTMLMITVPVKADRIQMTINLVYDSNMQAYTQGGTLTVTDVTTSSSYNIANDGSGSFTIDTDNLNNFAYGNTLTFDWSGLETYEIGCPYEIEASVNWDSQILTSKVYTMNSNSLNVGKMTASNGGGSASWSTTNLGTVYYGSSTSFSFYATYSGTADKVGVGESFRYEYKFYIKVSKQGVTPVQNFNTEILYVDEDSGDTIDPQVSVQITRSVFGYGTATVEFWFRWDKYDDFTNAWDSGGNVYPNPTSKTVTLA